MVFTWQHLTTGSREPYVWINVNGTHPQLEVLKISSAAGYIQTPGWGNHTLHPENMNSVVRVEVPEHHMVMITALHVNLIGKRYKCDPDSVVFKMYETRMTKANIIWQCRQKPCQRKVLSKGANLYVLFQSLKSGSSKGFKLLFTVHKVSTMLQEIKPALDMWNCSVANFVDFKPHFPCDLYPQCVHKEDERDCPYFSEECGLGFVTLADYCLVYVKVATQGTWRDKEFVCQQREMRLGNFRRREDFKTLMRYLDPLKAVWSFRTIAVGIRSTSSDLPMMYKNEMQNSDGVVAFYMSITKLTLSEIVCGMIIDNLDVIKVHQCTKETGSVHALCEILKLTTERSISSLRNIQLVAYLNHSCLPFLIVCPLRHVTRDFLACDLESMCWSRDVASCHAPLTPLPPSFTCTNGVERVPYTLVCDVRPDCSDGSDENFCVFPLCDLPEPFYCSDIECVPSSVVCDRQQNCFNAFDEDLCSENTNVWIDRPSSPAIVLLNKHGKFTVHKMTQSQLADLSPAACPETHFRCPDDGYCMPVFLRCNGVYDCPGKEDEDGCNGYTCHGFYRCRGSQVCLHPEHLCDRIFQCPQNDDELLCDLSCPASCTCYGLALYCRQPFPTRSTNKLRFLNVRRSGMRVSDLTENVMLIYLSLAENGLTSICDLNFPNLHILDLSDNHLTEIWSHNLSGLPQLETLFLSGNPMLSIFHYVDMQGRFSGMSYSKPENDTTNEMYKVNAFISSVGSLDLSRVKVKVINTSFLSLLPDLHTVNMSGGEVETILGQGFQALTQLRVLDLRGCPLNEFPWDILRGLERLERVYSDNYKLCCLGTLPAGFVLKNCHAPPDEISSCSALLGSSYHRVFVSVFAILALLGNTSNFIYWVLMKKSLLSVEVIFAHLCVANFSMGVYMSVIGVADHLYRGTYMRNDNIWKNSSVCQVAGFLSLMSTEVSALVICLITVERCLVIGFPFSTFHFGAHTAQIASLCAWIVGCLIAAVPLASKARIMRFYGQTGICIPLPDAISDFPVAFGGLIVANIVIFTIIIAGQVFIYWSVHIYSSSNSEIRKSQDLTIGRRFITVAMSDFLCWFPFSLVAVLAARGTAIMREVNVTMAILVLPFNSALSPFLYSLNVVLETLRKADEERIKKRIMAQLRSS